MTETWGEGVSKQVLSPLPTLLLVPTCSWGAGGSSETTTLELLQRGGSCGYSCHTLVLPQVQRVTFLQDLLGPPHRQMLSRVHPGSASNRSHFTLAYSYLMAQDGLMHQPSIAVQAYP